MEIIKYYIQKRISVLNNISGDISDIKDEKDYLTLDKIESFIMEYKLKFEDFGLSKENILTDLNQIENDEESDYLNSINNYFKEIFKIDKHNEYLLKPYDFFISKTRK